MSASDSIKDFVRVATTHGLAKDVIDLLERKALLLAEQVTALEQENTTLLRENRTLKLENESLEKQLQNFRPKGDQLTKETLRILKYIFDKGADFSDPEIAGRFQIQLSVAAYHTDILLRKRLIQQTTIGVASWGGGMSAAKFGITMEGRKYVMEHGPAV